MNIRKYTSYTKTTKVSHAEIRCNGNNFYQSKKSVNQQVHSSQAIQIVTETNDHESPKLITNAQDNYE